MSATCSECGLQFKPQRSTARFCSSRCRKATQRARDRGAPIRVAMTCPGVAVDAVLSVTATPRPLQRPKTEKCHAKAQASQTRSAHRPRCEVAGHVPASPSRRQPQRHGELDAGKGRPRGRLRGKQSLSGIFGFQPFSWHRETKFWFRLPVKTETD
jgi:hypothetical protein